MTKRTVQFKIYRYDPDKDEKPYMQDISVELEASDKKLLDALVRLRAKDDSMSFRRSSPWCGSRPRTTPCRSAAPAARACAAPTP